MLEALLQRLYSSDPTVAQAALTEINASPSKAVRTLLELLALVQDPHRPSVPISPATLQDQMDALDLTSPDLLGDLQKIMNQSQSLQQSFREQSAVIQDLRRAIAALGRPAWVEMLELARSEPRQLVNHANYTMLDFEGIATVDDLLTALQHEQALIRHRAIHMVAKQHNDPRVIPALMAIMRAPDVLVETREVAARALGDCGRAGVDMLLDAYGESSLRDYAGKGLLQSGDLRAFDIALEWLLTSDSSKRSVGLYGLERMLNALDTPQKALALAALVQRVRQGDENSFTPASKVIAQLGDLAVAPMFEILGDPSLDHINNAVRVYALDALWHIHQAAPGSLGSLFSESVRRLVDEHGNASLKATAIHILARLPDPDALDDLLRMLDERDDAAGLPAVVYAVGQQNDPRALPALRALLDHWKSQPQTFENFELVDEIEGAIDHIERG